MTEMGTKISHQDVQDAISAFQAQGGHIDILPDQESARNVVVGNEKYQSYEPVSTFLTL